MSAKAPTLTDRIRAILRDAGGPLTTSDILDALPDSTERDTVSALLSQRKKAGEFVVSIVDRKAAYSLDPTFVPGTSRTPAAEGFGGPQVAPAEAAAGAVAPRHESAPTRAHDGSAGGVPAQPSPSMPAAGEETIERVEPGHVDAAPISPGATFGNLDGSKPAAGASAPASDLDGAEAATAEIRSRSKRLQFGLCDRLDAIGDDLRDAFTDAFDADCTPAILLSIFEAFYAVHVGQTKLLRSHP